jgi:pimeloyl-ACP methyl ester carboxylesterase
MLCDAELWAYQTHHLAGVAIPSVGDLTRDATIAAMAERVLESAPPRFALTGLSLEAIVAFEIMRRAPARVRALALLNTNPGRPHDDQIAEWQEQMQRARRGCFAGLVEECWIPALLAASGSHGGALRGVIRKMAYSVGPESYVLQLAAQIERPDSWPSLAAITCPTLVLAGRRDTICPPELHEALAAAIPAARLAIVENCGHLSACEQPEAVTALLHRWLDAIRQ